MIRATLPTLNRSWNISTRTAVRTYSSTLPSYAAESKVSHEPPKKIHGIVGRYASATYTAASKAGLLDKVGAELSSIRDVMNKTPNFSSFLENPTISRQEKVNKISNLVDEKKFSNISRNLFITLCANGRSGEVSKVISAYSELLQASRGAVKVTIISAEPLKKKQIESIEAGVKILAGSKVSSVEIETEVNPSILGGLQVMIGDKFLDLSISSRVATLSQSLDEAI